MITGVRRILVVDPTPIASLCATGQFKGMLFRDWHAPALLELTTDINADDEPRLREGFGELRPCRNLKEALSAIRAFAPEVVYLRPEPTAFRHFDAVVQLIPSLRQPFVLHIMDDWLQHGDRAMRRALTRVARAVAERSTLRFTDGPAYVADFATRLGTKFDILLNGVDLDVWSAPAPPREPDRPFTLTHTGNYDPLMSRQAIIDIACAAQEVSREFPIRFDVRLRDYALQAAAKDLARYPVVRVLPQSDDFTSYVATLRSSDANVYAYSQDRASVRYMGKGVPNKTCELLAAGKPILAYGPSEFSGINYLCTHAAAQIVTERTKLADAIRALRANPALASNVASAQRLLRERHDAVRIRAGFAEAVERAARAAPSPIGSDALRGWRGVYRRFDARRKRSRMVHAAKRAPRQAVEALARVAGAPVAGLRALSRTSDMPAAGVRALPRTLLAVATACVRALRAVLVLIRGAFAAALAFSPCANPLSWACVAILLACLTVTDGLQQAACAGAATAGLAWMVSQAAARLAVRLWPRDIAGLAVRHAASRHIRERWPFVLSLATGALAGCLWRECGWNVAMAVAGLVALSACAAAIVVYYRDALRMQAGA